MSGNSARRLEQRPAVDEAHGDVRLSLDIADFVHLADQRVFDLRLGSRLVEECLGVLPDSGVEELERHEAVQLWVERLEYGAHASGSQPREDVVAIPVLGHRRLGLVGRRERLLGLRVELEDEAHEVLFVEMPGLDEAGDPRPPGGALALPARLRGLRHGLQVVPREQTLLDRQAQQPDVRSQAHLTHGRSSAAPRYPR